MSSSSSSLKGCCACMAVQLARLSPLRFPLRLSLLSLLARLLLTFASSHPILLLRTLLNFAPPPLMKPFTIQLLLFVLANFIILTLFFTSNAPCTTFFSFISHPISLHPFDTDQNAGADHDEDPDISSDGFIATASNGLALPSAPSLDPASAPPSILITGNINHLQSYLHASQEDSSSKTSIVISPPVDMIAREQPGLVDISQENSAKRSTASCKLKTIGDRKLTDDEYSPCNRLARIAAAPSNSMLTSNRLELVPTNPAATSHANSSQKSSLIRHQCGTQQTTASRTVAGQYKYYGRAVSCRYYYEYTREEACSTVRLYTASSLDSLSKEEANNHFSDFAYRKWAGIRKERLADCKASAPPSLL